MEDPSKQQPPPPYSAGGFVGAPPPAAPAPAGYNAPYPPAAPQQPHLPNQPQPYGAAYGSVYNQNQAGMMGQQQAMAGAFRAQAMGGYDSDVEGGGGGGGQNFGDMENAFSDAAIRRGFIRKVYGILCIQLLVTSIIVAPFTFMDSLKLYVVRNQWVYWLAFVLMIVCLIAMACCESVRRKSPLNFIFLGIFTLCEGYMLGCVGAAFGHESVMIAASICCFVTLGLTAFAFQTKYDFTTCGGMLCGLLLVLILAGFMIPIFGTSKLTMILYGSLGALIFSFYIVYDTQLMLGGKHKYSISPEEYVFAALSLYLDIVNLFLYILTIVGAARGD